MRAIIVVIGLLLGAWLGTQIGSVAGPLGVIIGGVLGVGVCVLILTRLQHSDLRR